MADGARRRLSHNQRAMMSGPMKAAVLMLCLGEELCAEIFRRLTEYEVKVVSQEISKLGKVGEDVTNEVIHLSHGELTGKNQIQGNLNYAKRILKAALGPDQARDIIQEISMQSSLSPETLNMLQQADPKQLSKLLQHEHPQTVTLIVSHLLPPQAAHTVSLLDEQLCSDVCLRLAQLEDISQPIRDRVIGMFANKLDNGAQFDSPQTGGVRQVAEIFNQMERELTQSCLETIENENPNMALSIRNNMFVFEDLLMITDKDMRKVIQGVDKQVLVTALKGTSEDLKEHFFSNMSTRAVEMLQEDMEALGPIPLRDAEQAQQQVVNQVREMEQAGDIELTGGGGGEYVS